MEINEVKELLNQFNDSKLTEFDLREGSFELYMNKNQTNRQTMTASQPEQSVEPAPVTPMTTAAPTSESEKTQAPVAAANGEGQVITSPIVGIVYLKPSPEQDVYKSVGDTVKQGETVCIIEAMKLLNEITSDFDGTITEILVENEDVVEYGQPLFRIS